MLVGALTLLSAPGTAEAAGTWGWAKRATSYSAKQRLLSPALVRKGPQAMVNRKAFVRALATIDAARARQLGVPTQLSTVPTGAQLADVPPSSTWARAVALGWIGPIDGRFAGGKAVTGDEAARGAVGALRLQTSASRFAERLAAEVPGAQTDYYLRAAQVYARVLDLRYNMPAGKERWEVGPAEGMRVAHVAYLLHGAATASDWRLRSLTSYETFDLPNLGANQARILRAGVELLGQPYVWAGETEGTQPEGHGGFDCSGFVWRTVIGGGVPDGERQPLPERTSMAMSAVRGSQLVRGHETLQAGDLMFWGYAGTRSKPADNFHTGVYMGNGWFIHSSGGNAGPNIDRLDGYWADRFSWGRRILRRA